MGKRKEATVEDVLYVMGIAGPLLIWLASLLPIWSLPCFFRVITGYYCPGCGGTRAVKALFSGNIMGSLIYHPVVLYGVVIYVIFMVTQTFGRIKQGKIKPLQYRHIYVVLAVVLTIVNFLIKNGILFFWNIRLIP